MQKAQTMQDLNIQTSLGQWQSLEAQTTIIRSFPRSDQKHDGKNNLHRVMTTLFKLKKAWRLCPRTCCSFTHPPIIMEVRNGSLQ